MSSKSWLSAKRIRIHGLLLAVLLWNVYAVDMSAPGWLDSNGSVLAMTAPLWITWQLSSRDVSSATTLAVSSRAQSFHSLANGKAESKDPYNVQITWGH